MKRVLILIAIALVACHVGASAQRISVMKNSLTAQDSKGTITITEDEGVKQAIAIVEHKTGTPAKVPGYRLVIFHDSEQFANERASRALNGFRNVYKRVSSYLSVESPTFRVLVGDCFNRDELAILQNYLKHGYPDAAICEVDIPLRILLRVQGVNNMKINRRGVVVGGTELAQLEHGVEDEELIKEPESPLVETIKDDSDTDTIANIEEGDTEANTTDAEVVETTSTVTVEEVNE